MRSFAADDVGPSRPGNAWLAVVRKDLLAEARSRDTLVPLLLLALLVGAVGVLALHDVADRAVVGSAILWTALVFAAALGLARAFGGERDRGTLDTLLALPLDRAALFVGKTLASFALLLATATVVLPLYYVATGDAGAGPALALFVGLGALGLAAVGTMLSALAAQTRTRDLMLPVLLFPILVPLLIAAVHGTQDVLRGEAFPAWRPELMLLVGYDVAFVAAGCLLMEEALA
ncbi:MAG TPA: heme exporter protein CcmB [Candidatus Thermoplasmatota archaeon]|nr:heme exporter protein CcmB [Candidatus Thermoplasmatota archaeon]